MKMWYVYTMESYSAIKMEGNSIFGQHGWILRALLNEMSETGKDKYCLTSITRGIKKQYKKQSHTKRRSDVVIRGRDWGMGLE